MGSGCLVLSLASSLELYLSLQAPSKTQGGGGGGNETHKNPNKAGAWQAAVRGGHAASHTARPVQAFWPVKPPLTTNLPSLHSREPASLNAFSQGLNFPRNRAPF